MARRTFGRGVMGLLAGGAVALLGGCGLLGGNSYRFRMTVEVETPEGLRTGSSVYEVSAEDKISFLPEMADRGWSVTGEAVAVDLPGGSKLFALLKTENSRRSDLAKMSMATLDPEFDNDMVESAGRIAGNWSPLRGDVAPADYPLLVTFGDIDDPASVERVDPANLAASFGPGVRLKRITVETTNDPVTVGIEERLGWLPDYFDKMLDGSRITNSTALANTLGQTEFKRERF
jgi:hypothetical protein